MRAMNMLGKAEEKVGHCIHHMLLLLTVIALGICVHIVQ